MEHHDIGLEHEAETVCFIIFYRCGLWSCSKVKLMMMMHMLPL